MTLQTSGPISIAQMRNEFALSNPISLNQFYSKPGLPTGGVISFSDFYGKSNIVFTPSEQEVNRFSASGSLVQQFTCNQVAVWTWSGSGVASFNIANGGSHTSMTITVPFVNGGVRRWVGTITGASNGVSMTWNVQMETGNV